LSERGVFYALCLICVLCLIVVPLPLGKYPFTVKINNNNNDRLCGLVVRVLGYRSGGPGSIPSTTRKKVLCMEQGPLSLVSTTEELLNRKIAASV
jgi:hypothetical protein